MSNIGLPSLDLFFKGLGASAVSRGSKGVAILIIKDDTDETFTFKEYASVADLTSIEAAKYTAGNLQYIKDALVETPKKLIVARMGTEDTFADLLTLIKGKAPRNCWIGIAEGLVADHDSLVSFVKAENTNNKKRWKVLAYKATTTDSIHIVNLYNDKVVFADTRGEQTGEKGISYLLGLYAGLSLDISAIAKTLSYFTSVTEPADLEVAVNAGKLVLFNEDGVVKVARSINTLQTTGGNITDDMKFVLIVEEMDLIYTDVVDAWNGSYKGKYKNGMDNQLLLVGAINTYFKELENSQILDPNYSNVVSIDIEAQRLANIPKYGEETVNSWDDKQAMTMTVGTKVFLTASTKLLNAMEDFNFNIYM